MAPIWAPVMALNVITAADVPLHRIKVKRLPTINPYPFQAVQPLDGASTATCPAL